MADAELSASNDTFLALDGTKRYLQMDPLADKVAIENAKDYGSPPATATPSSTCFSAATIRSAENRFFSKIPFQILPKTRIQLGTKSPGPSISINLLFWKAL